MARQPRGGFSMRPQEQKPARLVAKKGVKKPMGVKKPGKRY